MTRLLYADTGAFIALVYGRDRAHLTISAHLRSLAAAGDRLITSEPVISETVTRLRYDAGLRRVAAFRDVVQRAVDQNFLSIRESSSGFRRSAFWSSTRTCGSPTPTRKERLSPERGGPTRSSGWTTTSG